MVRYKSRSVGFSSAIPSRWRNSFLELLWANTGIAGLVAIWSDSLEYALLAETGQNGYNNKTATTTTMIMMTTRSAAISYDSAGTAENKGSIYVRRKGCESPADIEWRSPSDPHDLSLQMHHPATARLSHFGNDFVDRRQPHCNTCSSSRTDEDCEGVPQTGVVQHLRKGQF
jgi:hypothetical protein